MLGKKSSEKSLKNVFLYHTNKSDQKIWVQNERNNFSRNTRIVRAKNVGKKLSYKSAKNDSIYSHEYRDQKMAGKNARNNFSRNT